jgi:hypothetical protein
MKRYLAFAVLLALCAAGSTAYAQRPPEAASNVAELDAFHEVIFKIWHEAWPKKDTALLRQLLPDVEKGVASVVSAQLPGILREKKSAWDDGVKKLQSAGAAYKAAAAAKDDAKLLAAAETLHSQFEGLIRAIRPPLKELDEFHAVLYMLYHHYLPKNDRESIAKSAAQLQLRMDALNQVKLPERMIDKDSDFKVARSMLAGSVGALQARVAAGDEKGIKEAIESVHSNYQSLDRVFN